MPTARSLIAGLALALTATACSDKTTTAPNNVGDNQTSEPQQRKARQPLIFPANQTVTSAAGATYTLTSIQVQRFGYNGVNQLTVDAILTFIDAAGATHTENIANAPATLTSTGAPTAAVCNILILDIGAIHLDLLGLVVDLAPVNLDITAQSGPGNLLGNLLCAVTHLLDQNPGNISAITALLQQINALLMQIL
jgi:hypothetical protein